MWHGLAKRWLWFSIRGSECLEEHWGQVSEIQITDRPTAAGAAGPPGNYDIIVKTMISQLAFVYITGLYHDRDITHVIS